MSTYNVAFFADTHLDYAYGVRTTAEGINVRVKDGYRALHQIVDGILEHADILDIVIMGGDFFHGSHPSVRSTMEAHRQLRRLSDAGLPVHILAGNHDTTDNRSIPPAVGVLHDPDRGIHAYYEPYTVVRPTEGVNLHILSHHGLKPATLPEFEPAENEINIFTTHGAAIDPQNQSLMHCMDSPREQIIPPDVILDPAFQLRALGHYHSRYAVGHESLNTWYSGSTLRRGYSDEPGDRGWTLFKVSDTETVSVTHFNIDQRPQYDFPVLDANDLTPEGVQEIIIDTIRRHIPSGDFNVANAPIMRQKVINTTKSFRDGLDRHRIASEASNALHWVLQLDRTQSTALLDAHDHTMGTFGEVAPSMHVSNRAVLDLTEAYEQWCINSHQLSALPTEYKDKVDSLVKEHLNKAKETP